MADEKTTTPAAAAAPAFDMSAFAKAVGTAVAEQLQPLRDEVKQLREAAAPAKPATDPKGDQAAQPKAITMDDLVKTLDQREQQRATADRRTAFVADKLKDLPAAYRQQLGSDPSKWDAEEQAIRTQFRTDHKAAGNEVPNVSGDQPAGASKPGQVVDMSKLSAFDKIGLGLKTAKPSLATMPAQLGGTPATAAAPVDQTRTA